MLREVQGAKLEIGQRIPYFSLLGTDDKIYTVNEFTEAEVLVMVFTCNQCPVSQAYESRLIELSKEFQDQNVQFAAICANDSRGFPEDRFEMMKEKSKNLGFPFPYLHDDTQVAARAFDAACTPECFVFDKERKLCYHGRIDDNHENQEAVTERSLRDAIVAVLRGEPVAHPLRPVIGCSIKWKR